MDGCSQEVHSIFMFFRLAKPSQKPVDFVWDTLSFFEVKQLKLPSKHCLKPSSGHNGTNLPHN